MSESPSCPAEAVEGAVASFVSILSPPSAETAAGERSVSPPDFNSLNRSGLQFQSAFLCIKVLKQQQKKVLKNAKQ